MTNSESEVLDTLREGIEHLAEHGEPPPGAAPIIDIGTESFINFFKDEVLGALVASGGATCRFFEGAYGSGKTHLLQLLETEARAQGMAVVRLDLSQALKLEDWRLITLYVLENLEVTMEGDTVRGLADILDVLGLSGVADHARLEAAALPHPGFKVAMMRAVNSGDLSDEALDRLGQYLVGQRVTAGALKRLGVYGVKNPLSNRNAEQVLNTVVGALYELGLPGTMLLFDETERTLNVGHSQSRRVQLAANLMRRLIDACFTGGLKGTVAVFAVLPGFLEACSLVYPALGQRIQVIRGGAYDPAWRWPVLPVEDVGTVSGPEEFLSEVIKKFIIIVERCSGDIDGLASRLMTEGQRVLQENAGTGYRRALTKALAATAAERM